MTTADKFLETTAATAKQIIAQSLAHAEEYSQELIKKVDKELAELRANHTVTMAIQINSDPVKQLKTSAAPFLNRMITNAKLGLNTMLIGPAGCGKTFGVAQLAEALELEFGHLNLTAGASETWLFGRQTPVGFVEGVFARLYQHGGVFLADEMDAADPNLMLSINTAIGGNSFYNPISGQTLTKHKNFVFVGAANTHGKGATAVYNGRSRLDAATLDRFIMIEVDYNKAVEKALCPHTELRDVLWEVRERLKSAQSDEVISSRCLANSYLQLQAGVPFTSIVESISASWPKDTKKLFDSHKLKSFKV